MSVPIHVRHGGLGSLHFPMIPLFPAYFDLGFEAPFSSSVAAMFSILL